MPYMGERRNYLCFAQEHTENILCILSTDFAKPSYAINLLLYNVTEPGRGKKKYPLNISQKKSFIIYAQQTNISQYPNEEYPILQSAVRQ